MYNIPASLEDPQVDRRRLKRSFIIAGGFTAMLWMIKIVEEIAGINLVEYGIYPTHLQGLQGIVLAPLIHSSFSHLFANTPPLLILGTAVLYGYPRSARIVIPVVYLATGIGVWLFGRPAWHIGASGLTFGFMFFVFTIGALRWDRKAIALSMTVFLLYGGMIMGIFPDRPNISFESHLFGALAGLVLAVLLRNTDPRPPEKKYGWEDENDESPEAENDL
jgi:membrane associated rhomboid family serine protease